MNPFRRRTENLTDKERRALLIAKGSVVHFANDEKFVHHAFVDTPRFAADTGDIPPGLSLGAKTAFAHTNLTFHGDADGHHAAWGLNPAAPAVAALQSSGGTKDQWLAVIADSSNWDEGLPSLSSFNVAPEPSRSLLALGGLLTLLNRRNRSNFIVFVW